MLILEKNPPAGAGYRTGVKKSKNVVSKVMILGISRIKAPKREKINPRPMVKRIKGIRVNGKRIVFQEGVNRKIIKIISSSPHLTKNSNIACAKEDITSDSLAKFIFTTIAPP